MVSQPFRPQSFQKDNLPRIIMSICDLGQTLAVQECHYGPDVPLQKTQSPLLWGVCRFPLSAARSLQTDIYTAECSRPRFPHQHVYGPHMCWSWQKPAEADMKCIFRMPVHQVFASEILQKLNEGGVTEVCVCLCGCLHICVWVDRCWWRWGTIARRNLYYRSLIIYSDFPLCVSSQSYFGALFPSVITQVVQTRDTLNVRTLNIYQFCSPACLLSGANMTGNDPHTFFSPLFLDNFLQTHRSRRSRSSLI